MPIRPYTVRGSCPDLIRAVLTGTISRSSMNSPRVIILFDRPEMAASILLHMDIDTRSRSRVFPGT